MGAERTTPPGAPGTLPAGDRALSLPASALAEAVRRLCAGIEVEASFGSLDALVRPSLRRYFHAHATPHEETEDLVQKTLARVYQGIGELRSVDSFLPWLFTIARNVRRTAAERQRVEERVMQDGSDEVGYAADLAPESQPEAREIGHDRLRRLAAAMERLPAQQRQCLLLRLREEASYEEIALTLRLSVHTVRNHLAQARRTLRAVLLTQSSGGQVQ